MKAKRAQQGFSLLEIMIALVIIAFALMGILSATVHSSNTKEVMREYEVAKEAADRKLDELRGLPWGSLRSPVFPSIVNLYANDFFTKAAGKVPWTVSAAVSPPFSVDGLNSTTTADKKGQGIVLIHGVYSEVNAGAPVDPVYLVDFEVLITWNGIRGPGRYSARMMISKDNKK
jgi:prepilin-type N-terminal cleavage/methylation domain-containing protein